VASQKDQIQSLITEIDGLLNKASPRLPWVMSGASAHQRQLLERVRNYLISIQQVSAIGSNDQAKRQELLAHDIYYQQATEPQPPAGAAAIHPYSTDDRLTEASAQQILRAVVQEMGYLRSNVMQPLQADVQALQQQRESLVTEIRQLEAQRQSSGLGLSPANQQQLMSDFLQTLMGRLQESLSQQVSQAMLANQGHPMASLSGSLDAPPTSLPAPAMPPLLNPSQRLEHVQMLQAQSDQLLINLDVTLRTVFESLERNIQAYQASLSQGVDRMHSMGQQGEMMFTALITHLAQQLGREASSFLQSNVQPGGQPVAGGTIGQPTPPAVATTGENILLTPSTNLSPNPVDISGLMTPSSLLDVGSANPELGFPFAGTEIFPSPLGDPPTAPSSATSTFASPPEDKDDNIDQLPEIDLDSLNLNDLDLGDLDLGEMDLQSMDALLTNETLLTNPARADIGLTETDSSSTKAVDLDAALKLLEQLNTELQDQSTAADAEPLTANQQDLDASTAPTAEIAAAPTGNMDAEIKDLYESLFGSPTGGVPVQDVSSATADSPLEGAASIDAIDEIDPLEAVPSSPTAEIGIGTTSEISLTPRDSYQAYAAWSISEADKATVQQQGGDNLVLRLYNASAIDLTTHTPYSFQEFDVEDTAWNRFVPIPVSDQTYVAEVGYLTADRRWLLVAKSEPMLIPAATVAIGETAIVDTEEGNTTTSAVVPDLPEEIEPPVVIETLASDWDEHPLLQDELTPVTDLTAIAQTSPIEMADLSIVDSLPMSEQPTDGQIEQPEIVWNEVSEPLPPEVSEPAIIWNEVGEKLPPEVSAALTTHSITANIDSPSDISTGAEIQAESLDLGEIDQISSLTDLVGELPSIESSAPISLADPNGADLSVPDMGSPFLSETGTNRPSNNPSQQSFESSSISDPPTFSGFIAEDNYVPAAPDENLLPVGIEAETDTNLWLDATTFSQLSQDLSSLEGSDAATELPEVVEASRMEDTTPAMFDWVNDDRSDNMPADAPDFAQAMTIPEAIVAEDSLAEDSLGSFGQNLSHADAVVDLPPVSAFESTEDPFDFLEDSIFASELVEVDGFDSSMSTTPVADLTAAPIASPSDTLSTHPSEPAPDIDSLNPPQWEPTRKDPEVTAPIEDLLAGWADDAEPLVVEPTGPESLLTAPPSEPWVEASDLSFAEESLDAADLFPSWTEGEALPDQPDVEMLTSGDDLLESTVLEEAEPGLTLENMNELFEDLLTQEADAVSASPAAPPDEASDFTLTGLADLYESLAPNPSSPSLDNELSRSVTLEGMEDLFSEVPAISETPPPETGDESPFLPPAPNSAWTLDNAFGDNDSSLGNGSDADVDGKKKP
jgi:hypothetical protein